MDGAYLNCFLLADQGQGQRTTLSHLFPNALRNHLIR